MVHVIREIERSDKEMVDQFESVSAATAHEAMGRTGAMASNIKPIYSGMKVCGPAITVQCHVGDNIMLHKALSIAQPGDVLVAGTGGFAEDGGYWGEILTIEAQARGVKGLIIDGCIRDALAIKEHGFPVFSRGVSMKGTVKETIGLINHPICCGGVLVNPGDIVLSDEDGVVVIPKEKAQETLKKCWERERKEQMIMKELKAGKLTLELLGYDKILKAKGLREE